MRSFRVPVAALVASLVLLTLVACGVHAYGPDPFDERALTWWLVVAGVVTALGCGLAAMARTRLGEWGCALAALVAGAWATAFIAAQTVGTPFAYGGLTGDIGRLSAQATRFTVATGSVDPVTQGLPSEYPPLFGWIVGKLAVVTGIPAWQVLAPATAVCIGFSVVASWLLWRRIVGDATGLAVSVAVVASFADPGKCYETLALSVMLPWIISTFIRLTPDKGALGWLPAGVIGGLIVMTYQAFMLFVALGLVALVVIGLVQRPRWPYLRHLLLTGITAFVVSAVYLVPWLWGLVTRPAAQVSDEFVSPSVISNGYFLPWDQPWTTFAVLVAGIVLAIVFVRKTPWAPAMLAIILSCYVYRTVLRIRFDETGHTGFLHYTSRVIMAAVVASIVLGVHELWVRRPNSVHRANRLMSPGLVALASLAVVAMASSYAVVSEQGVGNTKLVALAHAERLPDGGVTEYAANVPSRSWFPSGPIRDAVDAQYGPNALPVVLSASERLFAFYPMYSYVAVDRESSPSMQVFDQRAEELHALAQIYDPARFAQTSALTRFGPIDVFVLAGDTFLNWNDVTFSRAQFSPKYFDAVQVGPGYTAFLRRDAVVVHRAYPS